MAEAAGVKNPPALARELVLLLQGLLMFRQVLQDDDAAKIAKRIAESRVQAYLDG